MTDPIQPSSPARWYDLSGRTALVIGASRGLGHASALALAEAGADVVCAARTEHDVAETAAQVTARGRRSRAIVVDASDETALAACVSEAHTFGALNVLVYAAGVQHAAPALTTTTEDWDRVLKINLSGGLVAAREAGRYMKASGGRMIFFGTAFVDCVLPLTVAYGVSKAGLHQMVKSLALEWARYKITVNAVAPGYFDTDMPKAMLGDPELRQRVLGRIPLRRVGEPNEIGPLVTYLASDASAFMTGTILRIDGGQSLNVS